MKSETEPEPELKLALLCDSANLLFKIIYRKLSDVNKPDDSCKHSLTHTHHFSAIVQ